MMAPPAPPYLYPPPPAPLARTPGELLGIWTVRLGLLITGLWLVRLILNWLPFTRDLSIPDTNLTLPILVTSLVYLLALGLLLGYARVLRASWPQAFPNFREGNGPLSCLVYLGALVALYHAILPILQALDADSDVISIFQAICFLVALALVGIASWTVYQKLPDWLALLRRSLGPAGGAAETACLTCGRLNPIGITHCTHCGAPLAAAQSPAKMN